MPSRLEQARALVPDLVRWRRHLHQYPELGFQEVKTQRYLVDELRTMGLDPRPVATTGIVVDIGRPPFVLVRADMDALPIEEGAELAFHSVHAGVMHACGHDGHMTVALGTAALLTAQAAPGAPGVRIIFQPSEERHPGGAQAMIQDGVLDGVTRVTGCHIRPGIPVGKVGAIAGAQSANSDRFVATIVGRGGHGSAPHYATDPVPIACEAVIALQSVVSRRVPPQEAAVVTIGSFHAGTASNVIPDEAVFQGTVRTFDAGVRELAERAIPSVIQGVAEAHGARGQVEYMRGYPSVVNSAPEVAVFQRTAGAVLGPDALYPLQRTMGGEDFAFYLQERPGVFWILGAQLAGQSSRAHNRAFRFDEEALVIGAAVMTETALALARPDALPV